MQNLFLWAHLIKIKSQNVSPENYRNLVSFFIDYCYFLLMYAVIVI
jgi:hypothetical protein